MNSRTEEERLRRDVARGAGSGQIRRLLALVEARERAQSAGECPLGRHGAEARRWPARVEDCRLIQVKEGQLAARFQFRLDGPDDEPEAISVHRLEGPLGLGTGFASAMRVLAPELDLAAAFADGRFDFVPEDFVGRRASVAVSCHRRDAVSGGSKRDVHFHFVTSIQPERA